mgnify:CR=1 FL=1
MFMVESNKIGLIYKPLKDLVLLKFESLQLLKQLKKPTKSIDLKKSFL